jgi:hypothetical protein
MCRNVGEVKRVLDTCCKDQEAHQAAHFER